MNRKNSDTLLGCAITITCFVAALCFVTWLFRWVIS